jgi:3-hydroxybutyrate dehydrogenase
MLKNKTAIVTGSTSGIGLGIARALAGAGANLMLNGFGDPAQIEALRSDLEREFGIKVATAVPTCPSRSRSVRW